MLLFNFMVSSSLPLRERGLKLLTRTVVSGTYMSLPLRERGLKLPIQWGNWVTAHVAPLAGAWIEMRIYCLKIAVFLSLPLRERGLKYEE